MRKVGYATACVVALGWGAPSVAQDTYGLCTKAASDKEILGRRDCGKSRPEFQKTCLARVGKTYTDSITKCDRDEAARVRRLQLRAAEGQRNAQPRR